MKRTLRRCITLCVVALLLLTMTVSATEPIADTAEPAGTAALPETMTMIAQTDEARLYFDAQTTAFCMENVQTGDRWSSYPETMLTDGTGKFVLERAYSLIEIDYYDYETDKDESVTSYGDSVKNDTYRCETIDNGVRIIFEFIDIGVTVPVALKLNGDCFTVTVEVADMVYDAQRIVPLSVHVAPYVCSGGSTLEEGYCFLPDGSGALVDCSESKVNAPKYVKPVYGKDQTIDALDDDGILAPCLGATRGDSTLFSVITADAEDAYIHCNGRGESSLYTYAWVSFKTLAHQVYEIHKNTMYGTDIYEEGGIKAETLEVSYYLLGGDTSGYAAMANHYKGLLFSDEQLQQAKVTPALFLDLYATVKKTVSILGFQIHYDSLLTDTDDIHSIVDQLAAQQVDSTVVRFNAWNKQENAGKAVSKLGIKASIGNLSEAITQLQQKNCILYPSVQRMATYEASANPLHTLFNTAHDLSDTMITREATKYTNLRYFLKHELLNKNLSKYLADARKRGIANLALDDVGNVLYSDHDGEIVKRPALSDAVGTLLSEHSGDNQLMLSAPNLYAAVYADDIVELPTGSCGHMMFDADVPFLQLVYSGVIRYADESLNMSGDPHRSFLKVLETGSMPSYTWAANGASELIHTPLEYLYSADYRYWLEDAAAQYATVKEIASACENTPMVAHEIVADGVTVTTYANGTGIAVNTGSTDYMLSDTVTVKAQSYAILKQEG